MAIRLMESGNVTPRHQERRILRGRILSAACVGLAPVAAVLSVTEERADEIAQAGAGTATECVRLVATVAAVTLPTRTPVVNVPPDRDVLRIGAWVPEAPPSPRRPRPWRIDELRRDLDTVTRDCADARKTMEGGSMAA